MSATPRIERKKVFHVQRGGVLLLEQDDGVVLALKAERDGKDFVNHYAVALDPRPAGLHALTYLDPDAEILHVTGRAVFELGSETRHQGSGPLEPGTIFATPRGTFLKLDGIWGAEQQKSQVYLDINTGAVELRRERGVSATYDDWSVRKIEDGAAHSAVDLRNLAGLPGPA